jgi:amino acid adenylation domain-containing protein
MVPSAWVALETLPLTPNGKLDRNALPAPEDSSQGQRDYAVPQGPVETALALIWSELLRVERVGRYDRFFELGGHSLLAVRMISQLRQRLGLEVSVSSVFDHPALQDFARVASETKATVSTPLASSTRPDAIPLSFAQHRIWLAVQFGEGASAAYHMPVGLRLRGRLNEAALQATLNRIVQRHEALRTYFEHVDGQPVQRIGASSRFALLCEALEVAPEQRDAVITQWSRLEAQAPFDLGHGPLIRGRLLRLDEQDHVLLLTMHHIICDGWSMGVLASEISALYRAFAVEGVAYTSDPLPPLPVQYADYALWQRQWLDVPAQERLLAYWRAQLAGSPLLSTLPTDHPRPATQGFVGGMVSAQVPQETTAALNALAQRHTSTLFMVLMTAFNVLLSRYSGQTDLNVGTVVANRNRAELEPLIGLLLDTQVIRTRLDPAQSFASLLQQVRDTLIQAYLHQELPFDKLLEALKPARRPGVPPLFQVMLLWNMHEQVVTLPELRLEVMPPPEHTAKFDLTLYTTECDGVLHLAYEYDAALFEAATIERLAARFTRLLEAVVAVPEARIDELGVPEALPAMAREISAVSDSGERRPLTTHQQRLWFIEVFEAGVLYDTAPTYHNLPLLLDFGADPVSPVQLETALNIVVARHDALRTRIHSDGSVAWQSVDPRAPLTLEQIELKDGETLLTRAVAEVRRPFKLDRDRLVRAALLRGRDGETWLCAAVHHIVADRRSLQLLAQELVAAYAATIEGRAPTLAALPLSFGDYARWQLALGPEAIEPQLLYWKQHLHGRLQAMELPLNRPRPAVHTFTAGCHGAAIDAELGGRLRTLARDRTVTIEDVLLTGFNILLRRYTGHDELVIGTSVSGRDRPGLQPVIGPLANLLVLRTGVPEKCTVETLLARVARTRARALQHGDLPFDLLALKLNPDKDMSRTVLFDIVFQYDGEAGQVVPSGTVAARQVETNLGYGKYDLHLCVFPQDGGFEARLVYNSDFFDEWFIAQMMRHFVRLLREMAEDPRRGIDDLPILDAAEHEGLLRVSGRDASYPDDETVSQLFEEQARLRPAQVALVCGEVTLTYGQLNSRANQLAHHLRTVGVGVEQTVALLLERTPEMIIAMLAVNKAGGAYVPIDPEVPHERLRFVLEDSGCRHIITTAGRAQTLPRTAAEPILLDTDRARISRQPTRNLVSLNRPEHLIYVIYTSGSTGQPKGSLLEHRNVVRLLFNEHLQFELSARDTWSMFHSYAFDFTVWEIYGALLYGGRLVIVPSEVRKDPAQLLDLVVRERVSVLSQTPTAFYGLADEALRRGEALSLDALRYVVFGGEALSPSRLRDFHAAHPQVNLINMYGITETCVHVTFKRIGTAEIERGESNIGVSIPTTHTYILDAGQRLLPRGVPGEICVGGLGVGRGYLNRNELTQQHFIPNPYRPGERLYRSGDRGKLLENGEMLYLGRDDHQVKIRGFRIELGEIEAQLARQPGVREAVVLAREDEPGYTRLVAYILGVVEHVPDPQVLRQALGQSLPDYMVPAAYVVLSAWPLTENGKLARQALPIPERATFGHSDYEAPQGAVETRLAQIWRDLLHVERVGRHDGFFELGGHSLLAVQLVERLRREGLHADMRTLFSQPTLAALAQSLEEAHRTGWRPVAVPDNAIPPGCEMITPEMLPLLELDPEQIERVVAAVPGGVANVQDIYPLAPLQEGILFHHLLHTHSDPYLLSTLLSFDSRARLDGFIQALQQVIDRHDVLRTAVVWEGLPEPVQVVLRQARIEVRTPDPSAGDTAARLAEQADPRRDRLDLQRAPLIRGCAAFDERGNRWLLQLVHHHLVVDHTTVDVLLYEIGLILSGHTQELPVPVPFRNFVAQARLGVSIEEHEAFFRQMLGDVDEPTAPFGLLDVRGAGENVHEARLALPSALSQRLRRQGRILGVSTASLFHWAWAQVLAKTTDREDVVFGTVLFGRMQGGVGTDRAMGLFVNTLPVRIRLGELGVQEGIRQTHASLLSLMHHEHASLALAQRCSALSATTPLFSALLNYRHDTEAGGGMSAKDWAQGVDVLSVQERTNYPFMLSVDDLGEGFELNAQMAQPIEPQRICAYMHNALEHLVQALEQAPRTASWQIEVLGEFERQQMLAIWNDTQRSWSLELCIHELFERQVATTPQAIALEHEERQLSYLALNERANQLARHLRELGVGPEERVAICLRRSVEMVVAILAVLKAGGAYVPLDPSYPRERLDYMLHNSQPRVVLTQTGRQAVSGPRTGTVVLNLDGPRRPWEQLSVDNLAVADLGLTSNHLAYVIYTSGSTGQPKGVMIEHANAVNFINWSRDSFAAAELQDTLFSTSLSFDLAVFECFAPLSCGGCIHLVDDILVLGTQVMPVSLINTVPSALQAIVSQGAVPASARVVNVAGEPLKRQLVEELFETTGITAVCNLYGPSETTTYSTWTRMARAVGFDPSIGRPVANTKIYLLDARGQLVPPGVAGEVFIGGAGVARGYLNRPELTRERFVPDPFATKPDARMYKTGDLGRWRADGTLEYLGRNDHQVKIRGFRIELGEIEARLLAQPGVREALVLAREDAPGDKYLVAYVAGAGDAELDPRALRDALARVLPDNMVPAAWVVLPALPLTPNGKVDRKALPLPASQGLAHDTYEPPQGLIETTLARIWSELLRVDRVGRNDNFLELGGHSLLATKLISHVRGEWDIELPLITVFSKPRLAELSEAVVDCQLAQFDAGELESIIARQKDLVR